MFFEIERCLSAELLLSNASERVVVDTGRIGARRAIPEIAAEAARATGCVVSVTEVQETGGMGKQDTKGRVMNWNQHKVVLMSSRVASDELESKESSMVDDGEFLFDVLNGLSALAELV